MSTQTCTYCEAEQDSSQFISNRKKQYPAGLCRSCTRKIKTVKGFATLVRHKVPEYAEIVRAYVRKEMSKYRASKNKKYYAGIRTATENAHKRAIERLAKIQGSLCAFAGQTDKYGKCCFKNPAGGTTPHFDHVNEDGRFDRKHPESVAYEILRMANPEEKYQLLCRRHNLVKYHAFSPYLEQDNARRQSSGMKNIRVGSKLRAMPIDLAVIEMSQDFLKTAA